MQEESPSCLIRLQHHCFNSLLLPQDLENTFDGWTGDLAHLTVLRESLSCYISAEDLSVLQERIELLHRQWDEICHQVPRSAPRPTFSDSVIKLKKNCSGIQLKYDKVHHRRALYGQS